MFYHSYQGFLSLAPFGVTLILNSLWLSIIRIANLSLNI
jgi:hypothetical protein